MMRRKLNRIGNSYGLIIPRTILGLIGVDPVKDELEFTIMGDTLTIKKSHPDARKAPKDPG